jgi:signal transduction histidine kinase
MFFYRKFSSGSILVFILPLLWVAFLACNNNLHTTIIQSSPHFDSLLDKASSIYNTGDTLQTFKYLNAITPEYKKANVLEKFRYYNFYADMYASRLKDYYNAMAYADSMMILIENNKLQDVLPVEWAHVNYIKGDILFDMGDYEKAYDYYFKARFISKNNGDTCVLAYYTYRVAMVLYRQQKYREATNDFRQSIKEYHYCSKDFVFFYRNQEILDNIGLCYYQLNKPDSALDYYQQALTYIDQESPAFLPAKQHECDEAKGVIYGNIGSIYSIKKNYQLAEKWYKMSIAINAEKGHDMVDAQYTKIKLADIYFNQARYADMLVLMQQVRTFLDQLPDIEAEMRWNKLMSKYYNTINKPADAFTSLVRYTTLKDSLDRNIETLRSMDVDQRVNTREKENQIRLLNKQSELKGAYLTLAVLSTVLAIIIILLIYQNWARSRKNMEKLMLLNANVKRQKNQLEKANEEKDRILKTVAHDVRSPVNSILALTDLILANPEKITPEQEEFLQLIREASANTLELSKDILEAASLLKPENIKKETVNINQLLTNSVNLLKPRAAEKNQHINLHIPADKFQLYIDKDKIARVITNLVTNAIKFSPSGVDIDVSLQKNKEGLLISVYDKGIGIPDNIKDKIFDMFTEAKRTGTSGEKPFGLGLSISKQIIESHGGRIWFESLPGSGTIFYISLPE